MDTVDPPLQNTYNTLLRKSSINGHPVVVGASAAVDERELPLIDLARLSQGEAEREECKREIARAAREWGFFQIVNHGISGEILKRMRTEQEKLFKQPFRVKTEDKVQNFSAGRYRWGGPTATCLQQLSWLEAFHVPLTDIHADISASGGFSTLSLIIEQFAIVASNLAQRLAEILADKMGQDGSFFEENCSPNACYIRMNRYPPCPMSSKVHGLVPHTDSDFLTVLNQDQIGGLQLVKDGKWIAVKPNPQALVINIGDLFQAWSNGVYKSVEHKVVANKKVDRFSTAYFFCPSHDTMIRSCVEPSIYRNFSFREYMQQVQDDVKKFGNKVGLPRFLI
ncbi:gibberellin 2-beta-dioxygenase 8-like [Malania oleifera]|uniref:gibberellin 2-beta-dioxygenase 8-like n=1 Tax=Malania oleifera TaxID=397392 RepID=UPI0025AE0AAA|nr:gibberellin 2-beta-dioxygenase 8-like [Malania oleifera]